jgi:hypothetical protein
MRDVIASAGRFRAGPRSPAAGLVTLGLVVPDPGAILPWATIAGPGAR